MDKRLRDTLSVSELDVILQRGLRQQPQLDCSFLFALISLLLLNVDFPSLACLLALPVFDRAELQQTLAEMESPNLFSQEKRENLKADAGARGPEWTRDCQVRQLLNT